MTSIRSLLLRFVPLTFAACSAIESPADVQDTVESEIDSAEPDGAVEDSAPEVDALEDLAETSPPPECGPGSTSRSLDPCDDFDACTADTCVAGRCVRSPIVACCKHDDQCDDGIACTEDRCNTILNRCDSVRGDSFCCVSRADCDDFDACTEDVCAAHRCVYPVRPSCTVPNPAACNDMRGQRLRSERVRQRPVQRRYRHRARVLPDKRRLRDARPL